MKPKTLILMFVAIGCGLAASYMTSRVIADRNADKGEDEKVAILVAKQNLATGYLIKDPEQVFEEKQYTKGEEPKKAIKTFDLLKEHRLNKPLSAEQFVTADDLMGKDQEGISALMQKGMRAVGLKVNVDSAVAGFVLPHCRVDIITVIRRSEQETFSKIVLQNVLVLAVDQTPIRPDDKPAMVASTVTVQVTPAQAEMLSLATDLGTLRLILRPFGDDEKTRTAGVTLKGLQGGNSSSSEDGPSQSDDEISLPRPKPKAKEKETPKVEVKAAEPPPVKTHTLLIYNGDALTRATYILGDKSGNTIIESSLSESGPVAKTSPRPTAVKQETNH